MAKIEIITSAPALSPNLPAPSIASNIEAGINKAAKTVVSNLTVSKFIDTEVLSKNKIVFN